MRANKKALTSELYQMFLAYYRDHPGDVPGCAAHCKCSPRFAKKAWDVGWPLYPWATPARTVIAKEAADVEVRRREEEAELRRKLAAEADRARKAEDEMRQMDENILRVARVDVLRGLAALSNVSEGVAVIGKAVGDMMKRGTDHLGQPLNITPMECLRIMGRFAGATKQLTDAASVLVDIERVKAGLPNRIIQHDIADITVEDAERELKRANDGLQRAKALGITVLDGGRAAPALPGKK